MAKISNKVRAVWSVLITSLAAPFLAGLVAVAVRITGLQFGAPLIAGPEAPLGDVAVVAFAWAIIPALITALALLPYVLQSGTYSWLNAAVAGVIAFGASAMLMPFNGGPLMPVLAFAAGLIAIAMRWVLIGGKIILP